MSGPLDRRATDGSIEQLEHSSALLTSYNAIKLSAREVASTFIAPPAFGQLVQADNALLTGPRGSGKTTLLKMLQSEALEYWADDSGATVRAAVRSSGVFIGADRAWNAQLSMESSAAPDSEKEAVAWTAFSLHVAKSLARTMQYRLRGARQGVALHLRAEMDAGQEKDVCSYIASLLQLEYAVPTFQSLGRQISRRLAELGAIRMSLTTNGYVDLPRWLDLDILTVAAAAVEAFNDEVGEAGHKWTLLFDELELAPDRIVEDLLSALRGNQPALNYKLSLSPAHRQLAILERPMGAVHGQDFEHIPLTFARKATAVRFSRQLMTDLLRRRTPPVTATPERLLGPSEFDSREDYSDSVSGSGRGTRSTADPYAVGSPLWQRLNSLQRKDPSFREYLERNRLDLYRLEGLPPNLRASRLRKIRNLVVVRDEFRDEHGHRRSRKAHGLYAGADSLLSLTDGNPRMVLALGRSLFPLIDGSGTGARVKVERQSAAIDETMRRFLALLESQEAEMIAGRAVSVIMLCDYVGRRLAQRLVEADFDDNARLTFVIDTHIRQEVLPLIVKAANSGAFVHVPRDASDRLHGDVRGQTFRLAYLLAPRYGLPLRLGPDARISDLLPSSLRLKAEAKGEAASSQPSLFTDYGLEG